MHLVSLFCLFVASIGHLTALCTRTYLAHCAGKKALKVYYFSNILLIILFYVF